MNLNGGGRREQYTEKKREIRPILSNNSPDQKDILQEIRRVPNSSSVCLCVSVWVSVWVSVCVSVSFSLLLPFFLHHKTFDSEGRECSALLKLNEKVSPPPPCHNNFFSSKKKLIINNNNANYSPGVVGHFGGVVGVLLRMGIHVVQFGNLKKSPQQSINMWLAPIIQPLLPSPPFHRHHHPPSLLLLFQPLLFPLYVLYNWKVLEVFKFGQRWLRNRILNSGVGLGEDGEGFERAPAAFQTTETFANSWNVLEIGQTTGQIHWNSTMHGMLRNDSNELTETGRFGTTMAGGWCRWLWNMEQWSNGAMEQWSNGAMEQWRRLTYEGFRMWFESTTILVAKRRLGPCQVAGLHPGAVRTETEMGLNSRTRLVLAPTDRRHIGTCFFGALWPSRKEELRRGESVVAVIHVRVDIPQLLPPP